jgi:hypothetical protein
MRRMLLLFMLVIVTVPLAGCVVYPARPHAPYALRAKLLLDPRTLRMSMGMPAKLQPISI